MYQPRHAALLPTDYAQLDETVTSRRASEIDPTTVETFIVLADALQL